jgi:hypothetical protein
LKAGLFPLKGFGLDVPFPGPDVTAWMERRLESAHAEQRAEIARRWEGFEQADKRFKEWVQKEQEQMNGHIQQVKVATLDGQKQEQTKTAGLDVRAQKLELKVQELQSSLMQVSARAEGLSQAMQASAVAGSPVGSSFTGAAAGSMQAALDILRADLDRETQARSALASEATGKIKELHALLAQEIGRHDQDSYNRNQFLSEEKAQSKARLANIEPNMQVLRSELDDVREQLRRTASECARRCDESENACAQRISGAQETSLSAARELWEEHHNVVAECKASLASLQQILESKDKIAAQLQSLQQQQRDDDKQELFIRFQQGLDELRTSNADLQGSLARELTTRSDAQQKLETHVGRLGVALEKAQSSWLKDSERVTTELRDARHQLETIFNSEMRNQERRVAEAMDSSMRRLDELEPRVTAAKSHAVAAEERINELQRVREAEISEAEARLKRHIADTQALLVGKIGQCDFDLRSLLRTNMAEHTERTQKALATIEKTTADECGILRSALDEVAREASQRVTSLREEVEQRVQAVDAAAARRTAQAEAVCAQIKEDLAELHREARGYAERAGLDARQAAEALHSQLKEDLARQALRSERACSDLARETVALEERTNAQFASVEGKILSRVNAELKVERERNREEAKRLAEEERSERLKAETERLGSLQKRLGAHEDLTSRRIDELRSRQDDTHATLRQNVETQMVEFRMEALKKSEDNQAELAALREETLRLDASIYKSAAELQSSFEKLGAEEANARQALQRGVDEELAALSAKMVVDLATANESLRQSAQYEAQSRAELREDVAAEITRLENAVLAEEERLQSALDETSKEINDRVDAQIAASDAQAESVRRAFDGVDIQFEQQRNDFTEGLNALRADLQTEVAGLDARLVKQNTELTEAMDATRADLQREASEVADKVLAHGDQIRAIEDGMLTRVSETDKVVQEALTAWSDETESLHKALDESKAHLETELTKMQEANEAALRLEQERASQAEESLESRAKSAEEELAGRLDAALQIERERALQAEGSLEAAVNLAQERATQAKESLDAAIQVERERLDQVEQAQQSGTEAVTNSLAEVQRDLSEALAKEEDRAKAAEEELAKTLQSTAEEVTRAIDQSSESDSKLADERFQKLEELVQEQRNSAQEQKQAMDDRVSQIEGEMPQLRDLLENQAEIQNQQSKVAEERLEELKAGQAKLTEQQEQQEEKEQQAAQESSKQFENELAKLQESMQQQQGQLQTAEERLGQAESTLRVQAGQLETKVNHLLSEFKAADAKLQEQIDADKTDLASKGQVTSDEIKTNIEGIEKEQANVQEQVQQMVQQINQYQEQMNQYQEQIKQTLEEKEQASAANVQASVQEQVEQLQEQLKQTTEEAKSAGVESADRLMAIEKQTGELIDKQEGNEKSFSDLNDRLNSLAQEAASNAQEAASNRAAAEQAAASASEEASAASVANAAREAAVKAQEAQEAANDQLEKMQTEIQESKANVEGLVKNCATIEALTRLEARTEALTDNLLIALETKAWLNDNVNGVTESLNLKFLGSLDLRSEKNKKALDEHENRLKILETMSGIGELT